MTLTALLLAGGASRRMGKDKATLLLDGEPLWARQLRILRELQPEHVWLSARSQPVWAPADVPVVLDAAPDVGPLGGLAAALNQLCTTHLLVLAVDLPRMTAAHLQVLWRGSQPGQGVIPQGAEQLEPLVAVYPQEAAALAREHLRGPDRSVQALARILLRQNRLQTYHLQPEERMFYHNANTPEEWP